MSDDIVTKDGNIYGAWNVARNHVSGMSDTIHSDELAQKMGQRGGMIVGWTYLDLFPPLFLETFGQQWFERGSLSIFFTYALMAGEQVRAVMDVPPEGAKDAQVKVSAETPEGKTVCTGTASIGEPKELSYLLAMDLQNAKPEDRRILHDLNVGDPMPGADVLITPETAAGRVKSILDPMDWYTGDSPWGGPILCPSSYYNALSAGDPNQRMGVEEHRAASFMGAEELRNVNGPIKAGVPYRSGGKFICVGSSPKTEFFWYDSWLDERDTGKRVAEMRQMWRYFKADSPELTEEQEEFAREVSAWLDENVPSDLEYIRDAQKMSAEQYEKHRAFMRVLGAKGWLWPTQPREYGGGGMDGARGAMVGREMAKRRLALPPIHDLTSLASTAILAHGTEEQKQRFLPAMFTGNGLSWQCFTEPEAGTDAANQQTNALRYTRDGDHFIINGQKIFVGTIHPPPDFMLLLTRSDAEAPRHQNLSAFICPGNLPGITIQPLDLFTLSPFMAICGVTGANVDAIKNSVFFDDVRIHESYLLGVEGGGWDVAQTALMSEHGESRPRTAAPPAGTGAKRVVPRGDGAEEPGGPTNYMLKMFLAQCKNNPNIVKRLKENPKLIDSVVDTYIYAKLERAFSLRNAGGMGGAYGGPQLMLYQKRSAAKFVADMAAVFGPVALTDDPEWVLDEGIFEVGERCGICQAPSGTPEAMKILISRALAIGR